ncbi:NHL repeat-containing protein [Actinoplanes italicus]|uniref:NHL repeat-containing protein n=2 Tax=Actinoplanes italicus TaxID=113567 RepID=A0A2T0JKQ9_9ACTN|nr:NHL repeat-containing protein [Actinoplanes italicus]
MAMLYVFSAPGPAAADDGAGSLTLIAGGNGLGFGGDGGPASSAKLSAPHGAAVAPDGVMYIADTGNHRIRAVAVNGTISTIAGDGSDDGETGGLPGGAKGTTVSLRAPTEVAIGTDGAVYIADAGVSRIYALAPDGTITVRAEVTDSRDPRELRGLAVSADGTVFVSDRDNGRVLAYASGGAESVVAGDGAAPQSYTPVPSPNSLAVDSHGDLWIAGHYLFRVRDDAVAPVTLPEEDRWTVGEGKAWPPADRALDDVYSVGVSGSGVYVVDNARREVRWLSANGAISTVMGLPVDPFGLLDPVDVVAGPGANGAIYLIDVTGSRIFAAEVPRDAPSVDDGGAPVWIWLLAAAGVVVIAGVVFVVLRRRRPREI